jgi:hypothetical protein
VQQRVYFSELEQLTNVCGPKHNFLGNLYFMIFEVLVAMRIQVVFCYVSHLLRRWMQKIDLRVFWMESETNSL